MQQTLLAPGPPLSFSFDPLRGKCLDLRAKVQADKTQRTIMCAVLQGRGIMHRNTVFTQTDVGVTDEGAADILKNFKADELLTTWRFHSGGESQRSHLQKPEK